MQCEIKLRLLLFAFLACLCTRAQVNHVLLNKPDTLSVIERLSIGTNMTDWALLMPNLNLEYELRGVTWNHWTVGLKVRGNWQTRHSMKPALVYNVMEARAEMRYYWRTRLVDNEHPRHTTFFGHLMSCRRKTLKHPNTTYYRGAYLSMSKFSLMLTGTGSQGSAASAGLLYGIVKPLYQFANGNALDLDLGVSGGFYFLRYDKYEHDRESNCYHRLSSKGWHVLPYPMLNELRLGLVYRLTRSPRHQLPERYRWRFDVDRDYREAIIEKVKEENRIKEEKAIELKNLDDVQKYFDEIFNKNYPVLLEKEMEQKVQNNNELSRQKEEEHLQKGKDKGEGRKKKEELKKKKVKKELKQEDVQEQAEEEGGEHS